MTITVKPYEITFESIYGCSPDKVKVPEGWELTGRILPTQEASDNTVLLTTGLMPMSVGLPGFYRAEIRLKQLTFKDLPPGPFIAAWRTDRSIYMKLGWVSPELGDINAVSYDGRLIHVNSFAKVEKYKNSDGVRP